MKLKKFLFIVLFYLSYFTNVYSMEPDVFVQSTVNRASHILSKNITKEEKVDELKKIEMINKRKLILNYLRHIF